MINDVNQLFPFNTVRFVKFWFPAVDVNVNQQLVRGLWTGERRLRWSVRQRDQGNNRLGGCRGT
jgi:hypothetical protein